MAVYTAVQAHALIQKFEEMARALRKRKPAVRQEVE
jgi:hypothetical protein